MPDKTDRDIDVLLPDQEVRVIDPDTRETVTVTVREFRFLEGLRAQAEPAAAALLAELAAALDAGGGDLPVAEVQAVMGRQALGWCELLAAACRRPRSWLERLSDGDGQALSAAMWTANRDFFPSGSQGWPRAARRSRPARPSRGRARPGGARAARARPPRTDVAADQALLGGRAGRPGRAGAARRRRAAGRGRA